MSAFDTVLLVLVLVLILVVIGALAVGLRTLRGMRSTPTADPAFIAEKDRQEQSLAALRSAADEANSTIDVAKSAAAAARAEAA
ncbi:ribonuclease Y, partial [Micromonospora azadirachtae]